MTSTAEGVMDELVGRPAGHRNGDAGEIVGRSPALLESIALAKRVGTTDLPVLIVGETGTGKELIAELIHEASRRRGPFVPIDCGALPEGLGESLLFGHRRGAFTGAVHQTDGLIMSAENGTLFMDELGSLSLGGQAMLLRALETKQIRRLGDLRARPATFRLVATAHDDLPDLLRSGRFRPDLLQRVSGVLIRLPSLRERGGDIEVLAHHFARAHGLHVHADATALLSERAWPGNVRELKATVARCALFATGTEIREQDVQLALENGPASVADRRAAPPEPAGVAELRALYREHGGDAARMAAALGVSRSTVYRRFRAANLHPSELRADVVA